MQARPARFLIFPPSFQAYPQFVLTYLEDLTASEDVSKQTTIFTTETGPQRINTMAAPVRKRSVWWPEGGQTQTSKGCFV